MIKKIIVILFLSLVTSYAATKPTVTNMTFYSYPDGYVSILFSGYSPYTTNLTYYITDHDSFGTITGMEPVNNPYHLVTNNPVLYHQSATTDSSPYIYYKAYDGTNYSDTGYIGIIITPTNVAPIANAQEVYVEKNCNKIIHVGAYDRNGDILQYTYGSMPDHGTLNGSMPDLVYTPNTNYTGLDSFSFTAYDCAFYSTNVTISLIVVDDIARTSLDNGLISYWNFDDASGTSTLDSSTNGLTGYLKSYGSGGHIPVWTNGIKNGGLYFNGTNDYVSISNNTKLQLTGDMTISFYVCPNRIADSRRSVVQKHYNNEFSFTIETNAAGNFYQGNSTNYEAEGVSARFQTNVWEGITLVRKAADKQILFYTNGVYLSTRSYTINPIASSTNDVNIGCRLPGQYHFSGLIDEFRLYNRALSSRDIQVLHSYSTSNDVTSPVISNIKTNIFSSRIRITWDTDDSSYSILKYGTTTNCDNLILDDLTTRTNHAYSVKNLTPSTTYYFKILAFDNSANSSYSDIISLTTKEPENVIPYASNCSYNVGINSSKNITLTGSDPETNSLSYSIIGYPTHGTLSGTAPNVTYTPSNNYSGADSFTYLVNDGVDRGTRFGNVFQFTTTVTTWSTNKTTYLDFFRRTAEKFKDYNINSVYFYLSYWQSYKYTNVDANFSALTGYTTNTFTGSDFQEMARLCRTNGIKVIVGTPSLSHIGNTAFPRAHPEFCEPENEWESNRGYSQGTKVTYSNILYSSAADANIGNVPTNTVWWSTPTYHSVRCPLSEGGLIAMGAMIDELVTNYTVDGILPDAVHINYDEIEESWRNPNCTNGCYNWDSRLLFAKAVNDLRDYIVNKHHIPVMMWGDQFKGGWTYQVPAGSEQYVSNDVIIADWMYSISVVSTRVDQNDYFSYTYGYYPSLQKFTDEGFNVIPCAWMSPGGTRQLKRDWYKVKPYNGPGFMYTCWMSQAIPDVYRVLDGQTNTWIFPSDYGVGNVIKDSYNLVPSEYGVIRLNVISSPSVSITNVSDSAQVNYRKTSYPLSGTNENTETMWWSNETSRTTGTVSTLDTSWNATITNLSPGLNTVKIFTKNALNVEASTNIIIWRKPKPTGAGESLQ